MKLTMKSQVHLVGQLVEAPLVKTEKSGRKAARFILAPDEIYLDDKCQKLNNAHYYLIVARASLAEIAELHLSKGSYVTVSGKLVSRRFVDDEGNKRTRIEICASGLYLVHKLRSA